MNPVCINLRERFGAEYRIAFDPAYDPFNVPRDRLDPWMMTIPCHKGVIYPHGGDVLAVELDNQQAAARKLAAVPGIRLHQDGGLRGDMTFLFPAEMFDQIAVIVRPKRRRRLSPEQRERMAAIGKAALARHREGINAKRQLSERQGVETASSGLEAV
jgi:hypothetical protein